VLVHAHTAHGADQGLLAALGLLSVAVSWFTVHAIITLRYALPYYADPEGCVNFSQPERPSYRDFAYLALTHDSSGLGHQPAEHADPGNGAAARGAVLRVRLRHPGRGRQSHRRPGQRRLSAQRPSWYLPSGRLLPFCGAVAGALLMAGRYDSRSLTDFDIAVIQTTALDV
jgi:hypothetical protein